MAGAIAPDDLYCALSIERQRRKVMDRSSEDVLLDEEGIALNDLSHQRSLNLGDVGPPNIGSDSEHKQFQSSGKGVQGGWRGGTREEVARRDSTNVLALGRLYRRMGKMSIIPRYFFYIVPVGALIAVPLVVGAFLPQLELGVRYPKIGVLTLGCPSSLDIHVGRNCVDIALGLENSRKTSAIYI